MNKLKSLFMKIRPESSLSKAILKTALVVLAAVLSLFTLIINPALFTIACILTLLGFFIFQLFRHFYKIEVNKGRRR